MDYVLRGVPGPAVAAADTAADAAAASPCACYAFDFDCVLVFGSGFVVLRPLGRALRLRVCSFLLGRRVLLCRCGLAALRLRLYRLLPRGLKRFGCGFSASCMTRSLRWPRPRLLASPLRPLRSGRWTLRRVEAFFIVYSVRLLISPRVSACIFVCRSISHGVWQCRHAIAAQMARSLLATLVSGESSRVLFV